MFALCEEETLEEYSRDVMLDRYVSQKDRNNGIRYLDQRSLSRDHVSDLRDGRVVCIIDTRRVRPRDVEQWWNNAPRHVYMEHSKKPIKLFKPIIFSACSKECPAVRHRARLPTEI